VKGAGDWQVTWNGKSLIRIIRTEAPSEYGLTKKLETDAAVHVFELPPDCLKYGANVLTIQAPDEVCGEVMRADVAIEYGAPETHGYF
ncbi:MAG: hypothetical protein KAJ81_06550, partial [Candidatus Latescibacteria bacterium]|nr:hypothetical protein [Candidatus Latescibacterota bacterium]